MYKILLNISQGFQSYLLRNILFLIKLFNVIVKPMCMVKKQYKEISHNFNQFPQ